MTTETEPVDDLLRSENEVLDMVSEFDLPELAGTMEEADARAMADRYLGAMRNVQADFGANEDEYKTLLAFQQQRHGERQGTLERQINWLHGAIEVLFGFMKLTGKKKSLNLLGGQVGTRGQQDELVVEDDEELIEWAVKYQKTSLLRISRSIDRKQLRALMEIKRDSPAADLVTPPGVSLKEREDVFFATPAGD